MKAYSATLPASMSASQRQSRASSRPSLPRPEAPHVASHSLPSAPAFSPSPAVIVHGLGKCYHLYSQPRDRLRQWLWGWRRPYFREHWALRDVSLTIYRGETVGIIGPNGSGKSTLLQILAGTVTPTTGEAHLSGQVTGLLELGAGFHPDFTGWENVELYATILGVSANALAERREAIAAFSELGEALSRPLRTYSSGMLVRLAFSVASSLDPDILLVDEALAVGDLRFQMRCLSRLHELRQQGVTILLVTHDLELCKRWCDRLYVLEQGRLIRSGSPAEVADWYFARMVGSPALAQANGECSSSRLMPQTQTDHFLPVNVPASTACIAESSRHRHGDGGASLMAVGLEDAAGRQVVRANLGKHYQLRLLLAFHVDAPTPVVGFYVKDRCGTEVIGMNTHAAKTPLPAARAGDRFEVTFAFPIRLRPGVYSVSAAIAHDYQQPRYFDWLDQAVVFEVHDPEPGRVTFGLIQEHITVRVSRSR